MAAPSVARYVKQFPRAQQASVQKLRAMIRQAASPVLERVYTGWNLIGYRVVTGRSSAYFAFITPFRDKVMLGFEYGTMLDDPHNILEGTGRQVRYVTFRRASQVKKSFLFSYIQEAAAVAVEQKSRRRR